MQNKPTKGEVNLYNQIKGGTVRALLGKSSAGDGWRPVCAGVYLGNECKTTEKAAISYGEKYFAQLKAKVEQHQVTAVANEKQLPQAVSKPKRKAATKRQPQ